jgi:hypothetical protein
VIVFNIHNSQLVPAAYLDLIVPHFDLKHIRQLGMHAYEIRPRKDKRGVNLISDALPFGALWYGEPDAISNAIGYAKFYSRSHDAVIRVYDSAGNVIETHEHAGQFKDW